MERTPETKTLSPGASRPFEIRFQEYSPTSTVSTYREDSEIMRFNRSTDLDWFAVSAETATVVAEALAISELSGGAFDPTIGPLVDLWQFGPGVTTVAYIPTFWSSSRTT